MRFLCTPADFTNRFATLQNLIVHPEIFSIRALRDALWYFSDFTYVLLYVITNTRLYIRGPQDELIRLPALVGQNLYEPQKPGNLQPRCRRAQVASGKERRATTPTRGPPRN